MGKKKYRVARGIGIGWVVFFGVIFLDVFFRPAEDAGFGGVLMEAVVVLVFALPGVWAIFWARRKMKAAASPPVAMPTISLGDDFAQSLINQGRGYIDKLIELNGHIANEKINGQIMHLITVSRQIFDFLTKHPAHARKLGTFMDYYFPTTLKFLENYAYFDNKNIKGENLQTALAKITESLNGIESAFEHQLESLYSDTVLDLKTDIAVLQNTMERESINRDKN
ncbi:MAG: 5-bromo-4-chloroindolyl phosphate hydrolysis family protein [Defluviitaleaceae bacterium]|nr:5-bromo-4-chloroindolyl phosphate hydrolysis family protein [Defluviitaleaceae bacterium]